MKYFDFWEEIIYIECWNTQKRTSNLKYQVTMILYLFYYLLFIYGILQIMVVQRLPYPHIN